MSKKTIITTFANLRDHVVPAKKKKKEEEFITPSSWNKEVMRRPISSLTEEEISEATRLTLTDKIDVFGRRRESLEDILRK